MRTKPVTLPVLGVLVLVALSVPKVKAVDFPTTVTGGVGLTFNSGPNDVEDFNLLAAAGGKFIREDLYWSFVETQQGVYNFALYDWLARQCGYRDMHRTLTLCYGNSLYGNDPTTQTWRDGFTNYAAATAAHYAGQDNIFEIWNEPDGPWSNPVIYDVDTYMDIVAQAAPAMHAADPTCKVLAPSLNALNTVNLNFLHGCIDQGLLGYVDAISVHPYRSSNPETAVANYASVRALMADHGTTLPIVCTEWGYSTGKTTGTAKVPDAQTQADYLARMYLVNASEGIPFTTAFIWKNTGTDPIDYEDNFGTVRQDLTPKPSYYAMKTLIGSLPDATFTSKLSDGDSSHWLLTFTNTTTNRQTLAAWGAGSSTWFSTVPGWGTYALLDSPLYVGQSQSRDGGSGNWSANAWDSGQAWVDGSQAAFTTAGATITVDSTPAVSAIQFGANNVTLTGGTLTLTEGGGAIHTGAYNATINSVIAGGGNAAAFHLRKSGTGTLTLGGANTFIAGPTAGEEGFGINVAQGTIKMGHGQAFGDLGNTILTWGSAAIDVNGQTVAAYTVPWVLYGTGVNSTGTLLNSSATDGGSSSLNVSLCGNSSIGVTWAGSLTLGSIGRYSSAFDYDCFFNLTKVGAGTLILAGSSTYAGSTTISAGTIRLSGGNDRLPATTAVTLANTSGAILDLNGNNQTIGSITGGGTTGGNVTLGSGTLTVDSSISSTTYAGAISGAGGQLVKQGTATLTLSGTNSYTGGTTINAGSLVYNSTAAIPTTGTTLINSGGTLRVTGAYTTVAGWLNSGKINTASTGALGLLANSSEAISMGSYTDLSIGSIGDRTYSGTMTPAGTTYRFGGGTGTLTVSSALSGSRSLVVGGNVTLSGSNSYTGGTTVNAGNLKFNSTSARPTTGTTLINSNGAVLVSGAYTTVTNWLNSSKGRINTASTGALALVANSSETINMGSYANLSLGANGAYTYSGVLTPASSTYRFGGGGGTLTVSSTLSGARALVANGNVTLTGTDTYTGATTVNSGTLAIGGSGSINSTSGITLSGGTLLQNSSTAMSSAITFTSGTFGGTGTYSGSIAPGSCHLAPGSGGIGTLTIGGDLTLSSSSVLDFNFGTTIGSNDKIVLSGGTLTLDGTLNIDSGGSWPASGTNEIISGAASIIDNGMTLGNAPLNHRYKIYIDGGSVYVTMAPEPGMMAMMASGLIGLLAYVWRKRKQGAVPE